LGEYTNFQVIFRVSRVVSVVVTHNNKFWKEFMIITFFQLLVSLLCQDPDIKYYGVQSPSFRYFFPLFQTELNAGGVSYSP